MKVRKVKKLMSAGTLFTIVGTNYVGMSLGCDKHGLVSSFNIINIGTGVCCNNITGKARKASKIEQRAYWNAMRRIVETKEQKGE